MVCQRCVAAVNHILTSEGITPLQVQLGEVTLTEKLSQNKIASIDKKLLEAGFERIDDSKTRLIEKIKNIVIEIVHHTKGSINHNWSDVLTAALPHEYKYMSHLFSSVEGITIEQYIIQQKIEKAKELIIYDELNTSQIAWELGYSSVAHLSSQFKKITGMTPTEFKKLNPGRKALDKI